MSLVNISLKLWSLNMAYMLIFLLKNVSRFCICKSYSHFFSKNTCELDIVLTRTVNILTNILTTNELVKLTMLQTTRPRSIDILLHLKKVIQNARFFYVKCKKKLSLPIPLAYEKQKAFVDICIRHTGSKFGCIPFDNVSKTKLMTIIA